MKCGTNRPTMLYGAPAKNLIKELKPQCNLVFAAKNSSFYSRPNGHFRPETRKTDTMNLPIWTRKSRMVSSLRVPLTVTERRNVISKRRSRDAIFPISFLEGELDRSKINSDRRGGEGREKNELLDEN